MTCLYIHDSCYLLYDVCLMKLICCVVCYSVLAGPQLMISACVEGSAGNITLMHDLGCRAVGFWKVEWCPSTYMFSAYVSRMFFMCINMSA